ncbi:glycosyltransferase [Arthrobacter sp. BE255]|uniref:glycosyltransferase n=1 Tax=Arthrobacter sp. BE255 TaxID=2817721 RepID=UPI00285B2D99|nr:glycosyltransferase [Arthrobacter sp. BE255]MDR7160369.1 teichuronic acid biosynthesis glycosyltransferase TuaH [Arthrobacter sp. BE255]
MNSATIVWIAGTGWDAVPGTDKRLVEALPLSQQVLWIDPPVPVTRGIFDTQKSNARARRYRAPEQVSENVRRVRVHVLPGVTRPVIRLITARLLDHAIRRALNASGTEATAVVVAFPLARFPRHVGGRKILYVTDDWIGGSALMGFSRAAVRRALVSNLGIADHVAVISDVLIRKLPRIPVTTKTRPTRTQSVFSIIPNGCPEPVVDHEQTREPVAGLVGQLNERLDLDALEAVQATGVRIKVIGPRADRDPDFRTRLDRFLAAENVTWLGRLPAADVSLEVVQFGVGLTPYADTAFNRASFPLKTLEYLAAGVAVVSTDMPAARWLNTQHVDIASGPDDFARNVLKALSQREDTHQARLRRQFAAAHTWRARAVQFLQILSSAR